MRCVDPECELGIGVSKRGHDGGWVLAERDEDGGEGEILSPKRDCHVKRLGTAKGRSGVPTHVRGVTEQR